MAKTLNRSVLVGILVDFEKDRMVSLAVDKILALIRERDTYVIGEDELGSDTEDAGWWYRNKLRAEQRQKAEETLE